jgi:hypothetical protein
VVRDAFTPFSCVDFGMACHKRVEDGQYKTVIKSNEKNTNQILLAQTPKRQMEKHAAGQNGQKLKAEQNGKSCSRAKWQKTKSRAKRIIM